MESGKGLMEHDFVRCGKGSDNDECQVGSGSSEDDMGWEWVDLAYQISERSESSKREREAGREAGR